MLVPGCAPPLRPSLPPPLRLPPPALGLLPFPHIRPPPSLVLATIAQARFLCPHIHTPLTSTWVKLNQNCTNAAPAFTRSPTPPILQCDHHCRRAASVSPSIPLIPPPPHTHT
eukprot:353756-Chlamydomonas_euryale.AAC.6